MVPCAGRTVWCPLSKLKMTRGFHMVIAFLGPSPTDLSATVYVFIIKKLKATHLPQCGKDWVNPDQTKLN